MVVSAAAGVLSFGVPHAAFSDNGGYSPSTTTITVTCGNGLVALGPIIVPAAPFTTTVVQCAQTPATHQEVGH
jgi:hypothetical protein